MKISTDENILVSDHDIERLSLLIMDPQGRGASLLEEELSRAQVIPQKEMPPDVVTMNSTVRFQDVETHKESQVTLVYPNNADVSQMKVSILAPIGTALLGLRVGQLIDWPMPNGKKKRLQVLSIIYQPEANQNWEL